jgi:DNA-binding transcriptional LysR family regulator
MSAMTEPHGIDVAALRVFCAVARLGSFSAAAAALHFTQSGVSRRIAALERLAGSELFAREPRGVRLTPVGTALHRHATEILGRLDAAAADLAALCRGTGGHVRAGSFVTANAALLPAALRLLAADRPEVQVSVREDLTPDLLRAVRSGALDLAVVSDFPTGVLDAAGVELVPVCEDPLLVALPATHRLAGRRRLRLRDLAGDNWVVAGPQGRTGTMLAAACARAGFVPRTDFDVRSWTAKEGFVAAGLGVTLVPSLAAAAVRPDLVLRPLRDDLPPRRVAVALPASPAPLPAARHLAGLLVGAAAALQEASSPAT